MIISVVSPIRTTASAAANGQLLPLVICSWIRLPTSTILFPPRISAIKKSPIDGIKVEDHAGQKAGKRELERKSA